MRKILILMSIYMSITTVVIAQRMTDDDFYSLYTLDGTKNVALDEIWNLNDSLLLVVGHKHRFNYFYVYELKTFQMVFDTSITASERFDGSLAFAYYVDSSQCIYFPKETYVNTYFEIDLKHDKQRSMPCEEVPHRCVILERRIENEVSYSDKYTFRYMIEKRKSYQYISVYVAKPYFSDRRKELNMDAKEFRTYLISGGR